MSNTKSNYQCTCGHNQFRLVCVNRKGHHGRIIDDCLVCAKCNRHHYISPCNTHGLKLEQQQSTVRD